MGSGRKVPDAEEEKLMSGMIGKGLLEHFWQFFRESAGVDMEMD